MEMKHYLIKEVGEHTRTNIFTYTQRPLCDTHNDHFSTLLQFFF